MGRAVVRDPEHAPCGTVRLLAHDIVDQSAEGGLASLRFTAAKDHRTMDVPGCQVLQDASALVLVLEAHCLVRSDWQGRVAATTDLDAGFFHPRRAHTRPPRMAGPAIGRRTGRARDRPPPGSADHAPERGCPTQPRCPGSVVPGGRDVAGWCQRAPTRSAGGLRDRSTGLRQRLQPCGYLLAADRTRLPGGPGRSGLTQKRLDTCL